MTEGSKSRQPRAFSLGDAQAEKPAEPKTAQKKKPSVKPNTVRKPRALEKPADIDMREDNFFDEPLEQTAVVAPAPRLAKKRFSFAKLAFGTLTLLVSLALGLWAEGLVRDLLARNALLGQVAMALVGVFVFAVVALALRELLAMRSLANIGTMRSDAANALDNNNGAEINASAKRLREHYANHPKTAAGRALLADHDGEIMDAADRYAMTERALLAGLDSEARSIIMNAAKRVSVVTAVSPRALVDIGYVIYENIRLIRVLAEHYGGRTGAFGTMALVRRVLSHLAVTGTIALTDSLVQQILGHGLAARLSARLGEGVVNGVMTARVGIAAMEVARPAPFRALQAPRIGDFLGTLTKFGAKTENQD